MIGLSNNKQKGYKMNLYELDETIKYYSNQKGVVSKRIVQFYKRKREELINRINIKLLEDNLPLIK